MQFNRTDPSTIGDLNPEKIPHYPHTNFNPLHESQIHRLHRFWKQESPDTLRVTTTFPRSGRRSSFGQKPGEFITNVLFANPNRNCRLQCGKK